MKKNTIIVLLLLSGICCYGQDGSDMWYIKINKLDTSYTGKFAHFDFYKRSFHWLSLDTVVINLDNQPISFVERRNDDGYNNWFSGQYLESVSFIGNLKLRMVKCLITEVTQDSVRVTAFFDYRNSKGKWIVGKSFEKDLWFGREQIVEVLVLAK